MRDPGRILKKILGERWDASAFEATGEPLDQLVELLREVIRCRRFSTWLKENSGIDPQLAPETFHSLLVIPEVNYSEETDRNLDVTRHSLMDQRDPTDPVSVAHLNTVLRELFNDLSKLFELQTKEYPRLHLAPGMTGDMVDRVQGLVSRLNGLNLRGVGYLLTGIWVGRVERDFAALFPEAGKVQPLRDHWQTVQAELGLYHRALEVNIKWARTGLDLFRLFRQDTLGQTVENLSALGSGLWNLVYAGMRMPETLAQAGLDFSDIESLLSEERVPLRNV